MVIVHIIMRVKETQDLREVVQMINQMTEGRFGNVDALAEGEKFDNCVPAACGGGLLVDGYIYFIIRIKDSYLVNWPSGDYGVAEIMEYDAYETRTDEAGNEYQIPNRQPYECVVVSDSDGVSHPVMMGF